MVDEVDVLCAAVASDSHILQQAVSKFGKFVNR
jgi:hypothetical protein